jgi:hypothetical protein
MPEKKLKEKHQKRIRASFYLDEEAYRMLKELKGFELINTGEDKIFTKTKFYSKIIKFYYEKNNPVKKYLKSQNIDIE